MKKYFVLLLFIILWRGVIHSQTTLTNQEELFIWVINNIERHEIKLFVELDSELCWDVVNPDWGPGWEDHHPLVTKYQGGLSFRSTNLEDRYFGVDYAYSNQGNTPLLGLGKYKITIYENGSPTNAYMFFDLRTSHLGEQVGSPDVTFYYDDTDKKIYYDRYNKEIVTSETIWNMKENVFLATTELEPCPPTNFQIINQSQWNSNPQLTWAHSPEDDYWTGYVVYRKKATSSYIKIATLAKYTTSYTDYNTVISEAGENIRYYVKAVNGNKESIPTQSIRIIGNTSSKLSKEQKALCYSLSQNYPNPFNPTTSISYLIASDEYVILKVYSFLGEEVAELVNEIKSEGIYSTIFNAENLPSGIYIYKITAGKYTDSRKLLLIK